MASAQKHKARSCYSYRTNRMNAPFSSFERRAIVKENDKNVKKSLAQMTKGFFKKVFSKKGDK